MGLRRVSAVLLVLALAGFNSGLCAGWAPTPDARMACCTVGDTCPMHASDTHPHGQPQAVTQSEADSCCAASEQGNTTPSSSPFVLHAAIALADAPVELVAPASLPLAASRSTVPLPGASVPKHVLLSVFLV